MKIEFSQEGGFGFFPGLNKPVTIDSNDLPAEEASHLEQLVNASDFFSQRANLSAEHNMPDARKYTITIEDNNKRHQASLSENVNDPHLKDLLNYLRKKHQELRNPNQE